MGIIGKIWNINSNNNSSKNIGSSLDYITNDEKCDYMLNEDIENEINYVSNDIKTVKGAYIVCKHILDIDTATNEMMAIKAFYGKDCGRTALHGIISLDEDESDIGNAGKLMLLCSDFLDRVYPNHQGIIAVHTNTKNLHVHFIINSVSLDGKKLHMDRNFMKGKFQKELNKLADKYGFSTNEVWNRDVKDLSTIKDRKIYLRHMVDVAIERSDSFAELVSYLRHNDITVNVGKHLSLKAKGMNRAMRTYQIGSDYTIEAIKNRIREKREPFDILDTKAVSVVRPDGDISTYISQSLKPYKEMTKEEKIETVKKLRLGRNPWKEVSKGNWMIEKLDNELNDKKYSIALIKFYAPRTMQTKAALKEILNKQEAIGNEIKSLNKTKRKYRQQFNLLKEAEKVEKGAYLYETTKDMDYVDDYYDYVDIKERARKNFNKDLSEIKEYREELEGNIIYLKAQLKELKEQYKILYQCANPKKEQNLFEAIGHSKAKEEAYYKGVYVTDERYVSDKNSDYTVQVIQRPGTIKGKNTVITELTVLDNKNNELEKISSSDMDGRSFNKEIRRIADEYNLSECITAKKRTQIQNK